MKMKFNEIKYDIEIKSLNNFDDVPQDTSLLKFFHDWDYLIKTEKLKIEKKLRLQKIKEINAKYK